MSKIGAPRTIALTALAMLAFAGNSILCRLALAPGLIDPASFSSLRLVAGAVTLCGILFLRGGGRGFGGFRADWRAALMLFAYVALFSFAYVSLNTGVGALILFGAVQLTMFGFALRSGARFSAVSWLGFALAIGGLVYLLAPGARAPDVFGAVLMAGAGVAWGLYSLRGRGVGDPLGASAGNFALAAPAGLAMSLFFLPGLHVSIEGAGLAIASGALASGCGYVVWYAALRGLSAAHASVVQLSVPVVAALGGVLLLAEPASMRLILASALTLGGVGLALSQRARA